jgi:hypothetical protein
MKDDFICHCQQLKSFIIKWTKNVVQTHSSTSRNSVLFL